MIYPPPRPPVFSFSFLHNNQSHDGLPLLNWISAKIADFDDSFLGKLEDEVGGKPQQAFGSTDVGCRDGRGL